MSHNAASLVVHSAAPGDVEAIYALECAAFVTDRLSPRSIRRAVAAPHRPLIVAKFGDKLAGYALVALRRGGKTARIYSIAVGAAYCRRGVGAELLHAAERYARAHGARALRLEVRYDNIGAIALYEKRGYRRFGRYPGYYADGAEAIRFEKPLAPA